MTAPQRPDSDTSGAVGPTRARHAHAAIGGSRVGATQPPPDVRLTVDGPGNQATVVSAYAAGAGVCLQIGDTAVRIAPGDAAVLFSRMATLAVDVATAAAGPFRAPADTAVVTG